MFYVENAYGLPVVQDSLDLYPQVIGGFHYILKNIYSCQLINLVANPNVFFVSRNKNFSNIKIKQKINDVPYAGNYIMYSSNKSVTTIGSVGMQWIDKNTINFRNFGGTLTDLLSFMSSYKEVLIYVVPYLNPNAMVFGNENYYANTLYFSIKSASIVGSDVVCITNNDINEYSLDFYLNPICNFPTNLAVNDVINIGKSHPNSIIYEGHLYINDVDTNPIVNVSEILGML